MRLNPGEQLGAYEVVDLLGSGGMAEVYRARDTRLGRDVAVKVVRGDLSGNLELFARLEQEARLAGSLNHPNIVAVHDVGVHDGHPYLVTELLDGETLRQRLSRGPVPFSQALDWAAQMARGLAAAHERGIVHRDLKPENVFIGRSGHLKLLDFGLAKPAVVSSSGSRGLLDGTLGHGGWATRSGAIIGSPGYMSPEQVRGGPLDVRSDIFNLGAIIYELLAGQKAFPGPSMVESGNAILNEDPPPLPESIPVGVAELVNRCLNKEPQLRFQSAQDLAFSLEAMRTLSGATSASAARWRRGWRAPRWRWVLLGAALLASISAFVVGQRSVRYRKPPTVRQLTFQSGSVLAARFAPDGRTVYLSRSTGHGAPQIENTTIAGSPLRSLGFGDAQLLAVSRNGELALTQRPRFAWFDAGRGTLARVPALGGTPRELTVDVEYADWAPDGERLAVTRYQGEQSRLEYPMGKVLFESSGWVSHPRFSPKGDRIAFIDHPLSLDSAGVVMVVDLNGHHEQWGRRYGDALGLAWTPDGREVLVTASEGGAEPAALRAVSRTGERVVYRGTGQLLIDDVAPDGRVLLTQTDWHQAIEIWKPGEPNETLEQLDWAGLSGVSDDGTVVLWSESGLGVGGKERAFLHQAGHAAPIELGSGRPLALSPDGKRVLVWRMDTPGSLWLLPTGPGEPRQIPTPGLVQVDNGAIFKDGRRLALVGRPDPVSPNRLYIFDLEQGKLKAISPPGLPRFQFNLAISPDQRWVAAPAPDGIITAFPVDGGQPIRAEALGGGRLPAGWLSDGTLLSFKRFDVPTLVERFDLQTRKTSPLASVGPNDPAGVLRIVRAQVAPNGQVVLNLRRMNGLLLTLDWDEKSPPTTPAEPPRAWWSLVL